jgi:hypothetical protein
MANDLSKDCVDFPDKESVESPLLELDAIRVACTFDFLAAPPVRSVTLFLVHHDFFEWLAIT